MAGKGESPYIIKQEGNIGWLWNTHLNRSPGGIFDKNSWMIFEQYKNIDQSETFLQLFWINESDVV